LDALSVRTFQPSQTFQWSVENHNRVIEKITRGLYYHHFGEPIPLSTSIRISMFINSLPEEPNRFIGAELDRRNIGGVDRFAYAFGRIEEDPEASMWVYQFYRRYWAGVITKPEVCDIPEIESVVAETEGQAPS
jgi:hypothetical protein